MRIVVAGIVGAAVALACVAAAPGAAARSAVEAGPGTAALVAALDLPRLAAILSAEGIEYGADLENELFPGAGGPPWAKAVARIHAPERILGLLTAGLDAEYARRPGAAAAAAAFFAAEAGRRIVTLELAAREALRDEALEEAARLAWEDMKAAGGRRVALLDRFVAVNDLVEQNVAGALNANLAFYRGMVEGGAIDPAPTEDEMMADLWAQEADVRADTEEWLFPFLAMAYAPLADAELEAYTAFSETADGRALNAALFAAFDRAFVQLSRELGAAAAVAVRGQQL